MAFSRVDDLLRKTYAALHGYLLPVFHARRGCMRLLYVSIEARWFSRMFTSNARLSYRPELSPCARVRATCSPQVRNNHPRDVDTVLPTVGSGLTEPCCTQGVAFRSLKLHHDGNRVGLAVKPTKIRRSTSGVCPQKVVMYSNGSRICQRSTSACSRRRQRQSLTVEIKILVLDLCQNL